MIKNESIKSEKKDKKREKKKVGKKGQEGPKEYVFIYSRDGPRN